MYFLFLKYLIRTKKNEPPYETNGWGKGFGSLMDDGHGVDVSESQAEKGRKGGNE